MSEKNEKYPNGIGPVGCWLIFAGIPTAIVAMLMAFTLRHGLGGIADTFGQNAEPYVIFFTPVVIGIGGMVLYDHFPKKLIIPLGIIGWIIGLSVFYWYFWFGSGYQ